MLVRRFMIRDTLVFAVVFLVTLFVDIVPGLASGVVLSWFLTLTLPYSEVPVLRLLKQRDPAVSNGVPGIGSEVDKRRPGPAGEVAGTVRLGCLTASSLSLARPSGGGSVAGEEHDDVEAPAGLTGGDPASVVGLPMNLAGGGQSSRLGLGGDGGYGAFDDNPVTVQVGDVEPGRLICGTQCPEEGYLTAIALLELQMGLVFSNSAKIQVRLENFKLACHWQWDSEVPCPSQCACFPDGAGR